MSEFVKKVLVFDEIQKGYAAYGKRVSGVVRLEKQNNSASAEIYVANLDRRKAEELQFVIYVDKKIYLACSQTPSLTVSLDMLKDTSDAACLVAAVNDGRTYPFAFASNAPFIQAEDLSLHLKNDVTQYEEFVCATDNYFEKETSFDIDELKKNAAEKFKPIEQLKNAKPLDGKNFFASVKDVLKKIFETYPPCDDLNDLMQNAFWVKVPFKEEKFFTVGIMQEKERPKYICYGVPGNLSKRPLDDSFSFLSAKGRKDGFWVLYQDAATGLCVGKLDG